MDCEDFFLLDWSPPNNPIQPERANAGICLVTMIIFFIRPSVEELMMLMLTRKILMPMKRLQAAPIPFQ